MILVTGATGTTGRYVVHELLAAGARVRALVRKADRVSLPDGAETATGDLADPGSLAAALEGVEKVYLLAPFEPRLVELEWNVLDAARRAGVRYVVKHSGLGASPDSSIAIGRWHGEAQRQLERSGLAFTHLQPHSFMQNLLGSANTIATEGTLYAPMGDTRVSLVDAWDIAAVAARVLLEPGHAGRTYVITGPEALTYGEMAVKLSVATGRPVRYVDVTPTQAKHGMMATGMPEWAADAVNELSGWYRSGHGALVTQVVAEIGRRTPHTFDTFARDHAAAFQGP
jgi:uncharacterized protein YbjT (DUF2867 family)